MWEYEIRHKRNRKIRRIFGETPGNAFRRFGLEQDDWILIQKQEIRSSEDKDGRERRGR